MVLRPSEYTFVSFSVLRELYSNAKNNKSISYLLLRSSSFFGADRLLSVKNNFSWFGFLAARLPVVGSMVFVGRLAVAPASHPLKMFPRTQIYVNPQPKLLTIALSVLDILDLRVVYVLLRCDQACMQLLL